ncbi:MAG: hypothetical protein ONB17_08380, partial [candidate division KSB1 bacterium]|nr:hypothetical protein [candidate division KSB1 bacterium]
PERLEKRRAPIQFLVPSWPASRLVVALAFFWAPHTTGYWHYTPFSVRQPVMMVKGEVEMPQGPAYRVEEPTR